jgi:hypothetical protein
MFGLMLFGLISFNMLVVSQLPDVDFPVVCSSLVCLTTTAKRASTTGKFAKSLNDICVPDSLSLQYC